MMCASCLLGSLLVLQRHRMSSHRLCFALSLIAGWKPIFFKHLSESNVNVDLNSHCSLWLLLGAVKLTLLTKMC